MIYRDFKSRYLELVWRILLGLFCLSIFTSKSGLVFFGSLLVLISIPLISWSSFFKTRSAVLILSLYPLAAFFSLFSVTGLEAARAVLIFWISPLLALPAFLVVTKKTYYREMAYCVLFGLFVGCGYSYFKFITDFNATFESTVRVPSFWDITRWGTLLSIGILGLFAILLKGSLGARERFVVKGLFVMAVGSLVLSNTRGPWLATLLALFVFSFVGVKYKMRVCATCIVTVLAIFVLSADVRSRFLSAVDISITQDGSLASADPSNSGRLKIWRVNLHLFKEQPWFGTGYRQSEALLRSFIDRHPQYTDDASFSEFSYRDQHSSYLTLLVQTGLVFSLYFMMVIFYCLWKALLAWRANKGPFMAFIFALSALHLFLFIFYSSIDSYEMALFFPFLAVISLLDPRDTHTHGKSVST